MSATIDDKVEEDTEIMEVLRAEEVDFELNFEVHSEWTHKESVAKKSNVFQLGSRVKGSHSSSSLSQFSSDSDSFSSEEYREWEALLLENLELGNLAELNGLWFYNSTMLMDCDSRL